MTKTDKLIPKNKYNRPGTKSEPKRICIHYTGSPGSGADRLALYFLNVANGVFKTSSPDAWTSTQYIVGIQGEIIRIIPDNEIAYAAAGKNDGTIHIEVCYPDKTGKFSDNSISALSQLVPYLMKIYSIDSNNVVRHYDLTGKLCPYYYVDNSRWNTLKSQITEAKKEILYRVQVGSFASRQDAQNYCNKIQKDGYDAFVVETN